MRVRKLGSGPLAWRGGSIQGGEVGDAPPAVVQRYAHKLVILDDVPTPVPTVAPPRAVNVTDYHVGGGWYEIPGREGKVRRAEAELLLT